MNTEIMLEKFAGAVPITLSVYDNDTVIKQYNAQPFSNLLAYQMMNPYFHSGYNVCFLITSDFLQCGFIRIKENNTLLLVGPASPYEPTLRQTESFLKALKLPTGKKVDILSWFHHLPIMDMKEFRNMLDFLNYTINDSADEPVRLSYHVPLMNVALDENDLAFSNSFSKDAEEIMIPYIVHGRYAELEAYFNQLTDIVNLPHIASNNTRALKNAFIASASITSHAAIKGGLDYDIAISLSNYYIAKMETLNVFADINQLLRTMLLDYTKRVANIQNIPTDSAIVASVCRFVNANLSEKISAKKVASALHLNESYLGHHFKQKTGHTLSEYICMQKVKEARFLLQTTTLPLSTITDRLAFSSQQYFQTVFKKYTNMTPTQYRREKN